MTVGEREERLREALTEICDYTAEHGGWSDSPFAPAGKLAGKIHYMARRAIEPPDGSLASSPSPPDRDLSSEGDERFRVFALMMYDHGCAAPDTCTQDVPCGPCAAADALGEPRWVQK